MQLVAQRGQEAREVGGGRPDGRVLEVDQRDAPVDEEGVLQMDVAVQPYRLGCSGGALRGELPRQAIGQRREVRAHGSQSA